jgi:hypothetical protein
VQVSSLNSGWNPQQIPVSTSSVSGNLRTASNQFNLNISNGLSPLASFALNHQVLDLSVSAEQTQFSMHSSDNSIAMRLHSTTDFQASIERMTLDFEFSAESLGLTAKDFEATNGKPIQFNFAVQRESMSFSLEQNISVQKTIRSADEVLTDIAKGIGEVLKQRGDKGIALVLDQEAIQSLLGASGSSGQLVDEVVRLLIWINTLKLGKGDKQLYALFVSGKGKPVVNVEEKKHVNIQALQMNVNITIHPPAQKAAVPAQAEVDQTQLQTVDTVV